MNLFLKHLSAGAMLLMTALPAAGQSLSSMNVATNLGAVLASEDFCGLAYDQKAIAAYIEKNVKATDMDFPQTLTMMTKGAELQLKELSPSEKTARCTQVVRLAKSYGFISK